MNTGIYQIINVANGKRYIGSAADFKQRWDLHKRQLNNNSHHSIALQRAWDKYGEGSFKFEILLTCDKEELLEYEQLHFDEFNPEYNILKVAGSLFGYTHRADSLLKMSLAKKGKPSTMKDKKHTEESRLKMSESAKANPQTYWQDKTLSDEHVNKLRVAKLGSKQSAETVAKRIAKTTGGKRTEEQCARISAALKNLNRKLPEERKAQISEFMKTRPQSVESRNKRSETMKNVLALRNIIRNWGCAL